jgi:hypothetical protein
MLEWENYMDTNQTSEELEVYWDAYYTGFSDRIEGVVNESLNINSDGYLAGWNAADDKLNSTRT